MFGDDAGLTRVSLVADKMRCCPIGRADDGAADSGTGGTRMISLGIRYPPDISLTLSHSVNLQFIPRNGERIRMQTGFHRSNSTRQVDQRRW